MTTLRMANIGSSFASGPGLPPYVDKRARRSSRNAAHRVATALGAKLLDVSIAGATTKTVLHQPQHVGLHRFAPQLQTLHQHDASNLDLIMVTAGGNDLGYIGYAMQAALAHRLGRKAITAPFSRRLAPRRPPITGDHVRAAASGLSQIVTEAQQIAPHARVMLIDYLTLVGPETQPRAAGLTEPAAAWLHNAGIQLTVAFQEAAATTGAELVPMASLSAAHALGSAAPWVTGTGNPQHSTPLGALFHPNDLGMQAVADTVVSRFRGERS